MIAIIIIINDSINRIITIRSTMTIILTEIKLAL